MSKRIALFSDGSGNVDAVGRADAFRPDGAHRSEWAQPVETALHELGSRYSQRNA